MRYNDHRDEDNYDDDDRGRDDDDRDNGNDGNVNDGYDWNGDLRSWILVPLACTIVFSLYGKCKYSTRKKIFIKKININLHEY